MYEDLKDGIAIIGWAGKFPGANNIDEFWEIIKDGQETISRFSADDLIAKGLKKELTDNPNYVLASGMIENACDFDSAFFGFTPREADFMDPQHRIFLETCYEALEHSGYATDSYEGLIGVFAGTGPDNYILKNLIQHPDILRKLGEFQTIINNGKDFLTTHVSYKLNLKGPSMAIQTACSTSLVAVHIACQNLLTYQCDIALAGGAFVQTPRAQGYMYEPGGIFSPDGRCRPFDKDANGTLFGEGVGVTVLKRFEDALTDRDNILAVIRGSAMNNDGAVKVGYMAPGVEGQSKVVSIAQAYANVNPEDISYIETHGTGTHLGDPIEISALTKAFRSKTTKKQYCALGSVKANIGHLDAAAGIAGLIKASLALKNKKIPPLPNFETPNPELNISETPFFINTQLTEWKTENKPRIAAVSAFGIGGTNSHCIIQEAPVMVSTPTQKIYHPVTLSAKTTTALQSQIKNLVHFLETEDVNISDAAFTLLNGRKKYKFRAAVFGKNKEEIIQKLQSPVIGTVTFNAPSKVFMLTGQGSQYKNMARDLYENFEVFRNVIDQGNKFLIDNYNLDIKEISQGDDKSINQTGNAQPALFLVQYATFRLLESFGISPDMLTGHSIGEITAACISGLLTFEDTLRLVTVRGRLMQAQKPGSMLNIQMPHAKVKEILPPTLDLALVNAENSCVVSGETDEIKEFEKALVSQYPHVLISLLNTSHAFHSRMMDPVLEPFKNELAGIRFGNIQTPFISNVTGTIATKDLVGNIEYWANHIRSTVKFHEGISEIIKNKNSIFIEVGPGTSLTSLLSQYQPHKIISIPTIRHPKKEINDRDYFLTALSQMWVNGADEFLENYYVEDMRSRIPLPTYPFERRRHYIDPVVPFDYHVEYNTNQVALDYLEKEEGRADSLAHSLPELRENYVAPLGESEQLIARIWEDLLGIKGIGTKDNFFDLGGHSLLASQVIIRINELFNTKLSFETLFDFPTIKEIVEKHSLTKSEGHVSPITKASETGKVKLSNEQKRLWVINKIDPGNPSYNIPFAYYLLGDLNVEIFRQSIQILFDRHKVLKSCIKVLENEPYCILENTGLDIEIEDVSDADSRDIDTYVHDRVAFESRRVFNLETGPLYRIRLIKYRENQYVFIFIVHHIVFDGWSWGVFLSELLEAYRHLIKGEPVSLPVLPFQYFDYASWQSKNMIDYSTAISYWKKQLEGYSATLSFPYDRERKLISSGLGGREGFVLDAELSRGIKRLSARESVTDFMTLVSTFALLLHRYSGDTDINIGTPTANRSHSELEKIIGFFVNTLVLRFKFCEETTYRQMLQDTRKTVLEALNHQELPFEKLVEVLQPPRSLNTNPIFQVLFAWQNTPRPSLDLEGMGSERLIVKEGVSSLDITVYMWENKELIEGEIEFSTDIIDRETIIRLKNNFLTLLKAIVNEPDAEIKSYPIVSSQELEMLNSFNNTAVDISNKLLHQLFEEQAIRTPNEVAAISETESITYKELNERANHIALLLEEKKVGIGDIVGVNVERNINMLASVLAVLKCGACYLPLDPSFPEDRVRFMLEDSDAKILISQKSFESKYRDSVKDLILVDQISEFKNIHHISKEGLSNQLLAYMIYTSGSTGRPKGVKIHHEAVVNFILSMAQRPGFKETDKILAVTTLSFDISILELFLPISRGGMVCIAKSDEVIQGKKLISLIEEKGITVLQATPATWNILLKSGWEGSKTLTALCGGEAMTKVLAEKLFPRVKSLWNMYGPTETTVWSTCHRIEDLNAPILVGKPIDNTQIYIVKNGCIQPVGVSGEVYIGGAGVSKGYHNRDELTREKFISGPDNKLVYRTGDLGLMCADGNLKLLGRADDQIKLRGYRIEPSEIEKVICEVEGINIAVVRVFKLDEVDERLVGFISTSEKFNLSNESIFEHLRTKLPNYMIPVSIKRMSAFPQTPNGKIDKKALTFNPEDDEQQERMPKDLSELEKELYQIWSTELKSSKFSIDANFFDIGGNSIMLVQLAMRVNEYLGKELNMLTYFEYPSIKSFTNYLKNNGKENGSTENTSNRQLEQLKQMGLRRRNSL